jgi:hypothetical protein
MKRKYWVGTQNQEIGSWPPDTPDEDILQELEAVGNPEDSTWIRDGRIEAGEWADPGDELSYNIAHAAGQDAGNRSMKAAGRTKWSEDDFNAAAAEMNRLMG